MVDMQAVARRAALLLRRTWTYLRSLRYEPGADAPLDAELERWTRAVIDELRQTPLIVPSRDLASAVLRRLSELESAQSGQASEPPPADR